jgi:DNA-binding NarL/FixJ family response regulator
VSVCSEQTFRIPAFSGSSTLNLVWTLETGFCLYRVRCAVPIKILIADDHEIVRRGVRHILKSRPDWEVCAEAANGLDAVAAVKRLQPDVTILDISMPVMSGLDAAREIARLNLPTRVLIFTMHYSKDLLRVFHDEGVRGYVLKAHAAQELIQAVETLLRGNTFFHSDEGMPEAQERPTYSRKPLLLRQRLEAGLRLVCGLLLGIAQSAFQDEARLNWVMPS